MKSRQHPRLSIAVVCFSKSWGGLEMMVARIASALTTRGHSVLVISPAGSPLEAESHTRQVPHVALEPRIKYLDLNTARILAGHFRHHGVQVALATQSRDISTLVVAHKFFSRPQLVYFQQMQFGHSKKDLLHRITYAELGAWITLTQRMKEEVQRNTIVPASKIFVIPFGTDTKEFDPKRFPRPAGRKALRLSDDTIAVGLIGRLDRQKGHEDLLDAAPAVLKAVPRARLAIIGEETKGEAGYLETLRAVVKERRLTGKVRFLPFTRDVPLALSGLDILAIPSHAETFGYVAIEAMAMEVPVVGTNAGGLPEIIRDGVTGFLVPPHDPGALAEKIIRLAKAKALRRSMGIKGRRRVIERFLFDKNVEALEETLVKVLTPVS